MNYSPFGPDSYPFFYSNVCYTAGLASMLVGIFWRQKEIGWICIAWLFIVGSLLERVRMIGCYPICLADEAYSVISAAPIQFLLPPLAILIVAYLIQIVRKVRKADLNWCDVFIILLFLVATAFLLTSLIWILNFFDFGECHGQPRN
jgi:hypothetical protein